MVILYVKQGTEDLFLFESKLSLLVEEVKEAIIEIYLGCLKIKQICSEMELLCEHGISKPSEMHGLLDDQIKDLKLTDDYEDRYEPAEGYEENKDPCGKRNGRRPKEPMRNILTKTINEAKGIISTEQIKSGVPLSIQHIQDAVSILKGGLEIVYPAGIPLHDPIQQEFENKCGINTWYTNPATVQLWFASKKLENGKKLNDYFGRNEKTKVVIKLQPISGGAPAREPILTEDQKKDMMLSEFKRRQALKKLHDDDDDTYLNSQWSDKFGLKKSLYGLKDVTWKAH